MDVQEKRLKNNEHSLVIHDLNPFLEGDEIENSKALVRSCHRYLSNRTEQLDYKGAIEKTCLLVQAK